MSSFITLFIDMPDDGRGKVRNMERRNSILDKPVLHYTEQV